MPIRKFCVVVLVVAFACGCGSDAGSVTGPNTNGNTGAQLTLGQASLLYAEMLFQIVAVLPSDTASAFTKSANCSAGGTLAATGSFLAGAQIAAFNSTIRFAGCVAPDYTFDGGPLAYVDSLIGTTTIIRINGSFNYRSVDGHSGTCSVRALSVASLAKANIDSTTVCGVTL